MLRPPEKKYPAALSRGRKLWYTHGNRNLRKIQEVRLTPMETDIRAVAPAAGRGTRLPREDITGRREGR